MRYDFMDALWIAVIVILTLAVTRGVSGLMASSENAAVSQVGKSLGAIVG
jgi:hypothetical protein